MANARTVEFIEAAREKVNQVVSILVGQLGWKVIERNDKFDVGFLPSVAISADGTWSCTTSGVVSISLMAQPDDKIKVTGYLGNVLSRNRAGLHVEVPMITMAVSKTPEKMAKEIMTRLMPRLSEQVAAAIDAYNKNNVYLAEVKEVARKIAEVSDNRIDVRVPEDLNREDTAFTMYGTDKTYGKGRFHNKGVRFDILSVPVDLALKIISLIYEQDGERELSAK